MLPSVPTDSVSFLILPQLHLVISKISLARQKLYSNSLVLYNICVVKKYFLIIKTFVYTISMFAMFVVLVPTSFCNASARHRTPLLIDLSRGSTLPESADCWDDGTGKPGEQHDATETDGKLSCPTAR